MKVWHAPVGKLIRGHVLDVNKKGFDRALKNYDPQLYTIWNPKKLRGHGCWEIRRKPTKKTALHVASFQGTDYYQLFDVEYDLIHHVLDCAFLNYDAIRKLKEMDTFQKDHWVHDLEYREDKAREEALEKAKEALKYAMKQNRTAAQDFYELVRSGVSPARILSSISWGS